jgi:hypothetical protein
MVWRKGRKAHGVGRKSLGGSHDCPQHPDFWGWEEQAQLKFPALNSPPNVCRILHGENVCLAQAPCVGTQAEGGVKHQRLCPHERQAARGRPAQLGFADRPDRPLAKRDRIRPVFFQKQHKRPSPRGVTGAGTGPDPRGRKYPPAGVAPTKRAQSTGGGLPAARASTCGVLPGSGWSTDSGDGPKQPPVPRGADRQPTPPSRPRASRARRWPKRRAWNAPWVRAPQRVRPGKAPSIP